MKNNKKAAAAKSAAAALCDSRCLTTYDAVHCGAHGQSGPCR